MLQHPPIHDQHRRHTGCFLDSARSLHGTTRRQNMIVDTGIPLRSRRLGFGKCLDLSNGHCTYRNSVGVYSENRCYNHHPKDLRYNDNSLAPPQGKPPTTQRAGCPEQSPSFPELPEAPQLCDVVGTARHSSSSSSAATTIAIFTQRSPLSENIQKK